MKPATETHWKLRRKLTELAARGIDGEKKAAADKLARLERRYDFSQPEPGGASIFAAAFKPSHYAIKLSAFSPGDQDIGSYVKWAIENGAKISAVWRPDGFDSVLYVEADSSCLPQLQRIVDTVRDSFRALWKQFADTAEVKTCERSPFYLGLYDGMMSDQWPTGKPLPAANDRAPKKGAGRGKKTAVGQAIGLKLHPYSIGLGLGEQIRFAADIHDLSRELESKVSAALAA